MTYRYSVGAQTYQFADLKAVLAKATPARCGDHLAGVAAELMLSAWRPECVWQVFR